KLAKYEAELHLRFRQLTNQIELPSALKNFEDLLAQSRNSLSRIYQIVRDFREFAHLDESKLQQINLNTGIEPIINIIQSRTRKHGVRLELDYKPLPAIICYPEELNKVVLNLLNNAIDACSEGGKVTVRTCPSPFGVEVHVIDTGRGMDAMVRER